MKLRVLLFAGLRERAGQAELELDGLSEGLDVAGLKRELEARLPALGSLEHVSGVLGADYVSDDTRLSEGAEIALLPPVSGGEAGEDERLERGLFELASDPICGEDCRLRVLHDSCGALVQFSGTVRRTNRQRTVENIDYEAFEAMAGPQMQLIFERCLEEYGEPLSDGAWRGLRMLCVHRVGTVAVGESSVMITVASPHRDAAFQAARFLIDELKESLPVWKRELYADGHHWIGERS
ncbi:MAG: molybdenum cofactor biosynthesis protein MoaE [bacterium]|jgi:molybdopterin synthase catalytic subunit|nr:molybdenum cofactor biosynthesis protein D/E [Planctomycetota bacterium]HIL52099.1 molybdenum cofactor biosynthesis protein D/E [Planctomycetota bacterium]